MLLVEPAIRCRAKVKVGSKVNSSKKYSANETFSTNLLWCLVVYERTGTYLLFFFLIQNSGR